MIYLKIQSTSSAKALECNSILMLKKIRKMTDIEIWAYKTILDLKSKHLKQIEALKK